jgi:hypothetical protein
MQEGEARIKPAKRGPSHARSNGAPHGHVLNFVIASPTLPRQRELSLLGTEPGIRAETKEEDCTFYGSANADEHARDILRRHRSEDL